MNNGNNRLPLLWFVDNIEAVFAEFKEKNGNGRRPENAPYGLMNLLLLMSTEHYIRVAEAAEEE
jgi:hypothetical protein